MQLPVFATAAEFTCDVVPDRERVVVRLAGELDVAAAPRLAAVVDDLFDAGFEQIVVDLRDLSFLDSAGVHLLLSAHLDAERRGRRLSVLRGPHAVHRVLELTGTDSLLTFRRDEADA